MSAEKADQIRGLLEDFSETLGLVEGVLDQWPEHASYLLKSFQPRSERLLAAGEAASAAARKLMGGQQARFASDYRWTCDQLRDEELFFHREGRYRLSTFKEAHAEVYSNEAYMSRYVNGLLLSQVLWYNHVATFEMFLDRVLDAQREPFDYLEIGPGHGLMTYFAAKAPATRSLQVWDVSQVSLRETRAALDTLGAPKPVSFVETDILRAEPPEGRFDLVVISEVLEHLETPDRALRFLRGAMTEEGRIFINVPLNSPSPDHIFLLSTPQEVEDLVTGAGFVVEQLELFATQAKPISSALAQRISVSAGVVARPA